MFAAEVVLEAYPASWEPENRKLQLENGLHDTRDCGKSQSPDCAHHTGPYVSVGPLQMSACPCSLLLSAHVQCEQPERQIWKFAISIAIRNTNSHTNTTIERGIYFHLKIG